MERTEPSNSKVSAKSSVENEVLVDDLPLTFNVKYLGCEQAKGLWGIKNTRRPVDHLVTIAKTLPPNKTLPFCNLTISLRGVAVDITSSAEGQLESWSYPIDTISYGVQDLVYTRVFAMIVVKENYKSKNFHPFDVHAFVCDSRALARKVTYALAASFQEYSKRIKAEELQRGRTDRDIVRKKFAIDLRTPEELSKPEEQETEA